MRVIKKITLENKLTKFIEKMDWTPLSIYCSRLNGDILVGKITKREGKVTRYNDTGVEIQSFQRDNQEQEIYKYPYYITANVNSDICTSDYGKKAVEVVDKSGQHRFSYIGQESKFDSYGICTDILDHILVCDFGSHSVQVLDQNGQFVFVLLTPLHGVSQPRGLCVDEDDFLFVTQDNTNTVKVFQYLQ
ncbi:uncharacterized protein LOC128165916 [Crassostrea angulata]|uniref:uncharacterized protein LOC128165916 n=1 Tax=Magallana angulata TaxID=2784310 RepID=UPI0022B0E983|nr:uncharacterized protein LOC128165916 [Crassostrea angulata]